jgi:tetratricopeptide (TPR) repeat protein
MAVPDLQDALDRLQQKDVDAAIASLERKIEELPAHLTAHVLLARAHEAKHQWDQALQCWENVYFLMPNSPVARAGKRRVLRQMNRDEEAEEIDEVAPAPSSSTQPAAPADAPSETEESEDEDKDDEDTPTTATEAVSELEKLRQQAEDEARRGGARANLTDDPAADAVTETPADRVDEIEDEEEDLDRLINELESARIEPSPDVDDVPPPDLDDDVDDLVSETLARIHAAQDQYRKAAQIYVKLASQEPDQAREHLEKAAEMRQQAEQHAEDEDA